MIKPPPSLATACRRNGSRTQRTWLSWPRREGISFPDSFDRVMPTLRAMVAALIESERVCINVCNGAHEAEARAVLDGLPMERITFHRDPN